VRTEDGTTTASLSTFSPDPILPADPQRKYACLTYIAQDHTGGMDDRPPVPDPHRTGVHPAPPGVHPALGRARCVGACRHNRQPPRRHGDGEQRPGAVLRRGCAR
jgi:hypothetical protein